MTMLGCQVLSLMVVVAVLESATGVPITTPPPSSLAVPVEGTFITVHSNFTYVPEVQNEALQCVYDLQACSHLFSEVPQANNSVETEGCGNQLVCCRVTTSATTIPPYVPIVTRADFSSSPLADFHACQCKAITSPISYLRQDQGEWTLQSVEVDVGFACDYTNPHCQKFSC